MTYTELLNQLQQQGLTKWHAMCDCGKHTTNDAYISVENLAKVAFLLKAEPFTQKGAKAINHDILNRIK